MCGVSKKPSVEKLWREKADMQMSWQPLSRSFGTNETQQLREGQSGSNDASEASYWCKRRETSEIQAKAYSGRAARHSYIRACAVYTQR